jgi:hypothetical protein
MTKISFDHEWRLFGALEHQRGGLNAGEDQRTPQARVRHRHGVPVTTDSNEALELLVVAAELASLLECDRVLEDLS